MRKFVDVSSVHSSVNNKNYAGELWCYFKRFTLPCHFVAVVCALF